MKRYVSIISWLWDCQLPSHCQLLSSSSTTHGNQCGRRRHNFWIVDNHHVNDLATNRLDAILVLGCKGGRLNHCSPACATVSSDSWHHSISVKWLLAQVPLRLRADLSWKITVHRQHILTLKFEPWHIFHHILTYIYNHIHLWIEENEGVLVLG